MQKTKLNVGQVFSFRRGLAAFMMFISVCSANGAKWSDFGAYDISWYEKGQSDYYISTPEELAGVAYLVNNNFSSFLGATLHLAGNISLQGRDWVPIGTGNLIFQGNFDGAGFTVSGITLNNVDGSSCGFWTELRNSSVTDLALSADVSTDDQDVGILAASAATSEFCNVTVESTINFVRTKVSSSTGTVYNHRIGGVVGSSESCEYYNLKTITKLDFTFGSSSGNNCYGNVNLYVGGIVGYGDNNKFELCKTVNDFSIGINGYVTDSYYTTRGTSVVRYGGIVGSDFGDKTEILSCYAITNNFTGCHYNGTYDTVSFCYGGIAGSFAENSSKAKILNCVAKTIKYSITGHNYSWVAAWYHTNSSFGGISINTPKTFGGCYSNNDVNKKTSKVEKDVEYEGGSTSFSLEQMNTQAFVDEINLYGRLELGIESWTLDENGKLALVVPDVANSIKPVVKSSDSDRLEIYDLNGRKRSVVQKGINILKSADGTVRKIYIK